MARETLEQFKILLEKSPVAMLVSSGEDQRVVLLNNKFTELFGYNINDIPDVEHWWPLAYPDEAYREEVRTEWNTKVKWARGNRAGIEPLEAMVACKDGSHRYIKFHLSPIGTGASNLVTFFDITERRREQDALSESEQRYREVFESSRDGFVLVDPEGRIIDCNEAFCFMLGYTLEELKRLPDFYEITPEKWHKWEYEEIWENRLLTLGFSGVYEKEYIRKDGSIFPVELSSYAVHAGNGELKYLCGVARDITEKKLAQEALRQSEEKLRENQAMRDLAESVAHVGVWRWDLATQKVTWSPEMCRLFDADPAEYDGDVTPILEKRVHPDDLPGLQQATASVLKSGEPQPVEYRLVLSDGTERIIRGDAKTEYDEAGQPKSLVGFYQDITEHKQAEEKLRESEEQYRGLFEDSKDMIVVTTPEGNFLDVNAAGVSLLGYDSREEIIHLENAARSMYQNPEDRMQMLEDMQQLGFLKDYGLKYKTKSGDILDVSATLTPVLDSNGEIVALRGVIRDMTEHHRMEKHLRQTQKMESIGVLAGGVAHEFNNKLTAIQGNIDLALMDTPKNSPTYEELEVARRSCGQAAEIVRQLLVFSRHETMQLKPLNLNSVLKDTLKMIDRIIGEQYDLTAVFGEDIWSVNADAVHIEQVIMNLIINARDSMPDGGRISVQTGNKSIDGEYVATNPHSRMGEFVHLSVSDTGTGIEPESLPRIFEPFYSTKGISEGGGLGLSVVYGIITDHKGWISVDSTPGVGTTFDFFLPAVPLKETLDEADNRDMDQIRGHGEKILLVEDEASVRDIAGQLLRQSGYSVTAVADAEEALATFVELRGDFDLVFSDIVLPGENGIALVDRLLKEKPGLKVLLTSGYSDISGHESVQQRGYPFIQKPFSLNGIRRKLNELLPED
ncbi:MAG: PAS domain S-box protein [Thermoleophilia bacterium]